MSTSTNETTNVPVHRVNSGNVSAAIWANETESGVFFSIGLTRRYSVEDEGQRRWRNTTSLNAADLIDAQRVLHSAANWVAEQPA